MVFFHLFAVRDDILNSVEAIFTRNFFTEWGIGLRRKRRKNRQ
jgi:hypothetical protein